MSSFITRQQQNSPPFRFASYLGYDTFRDQNSAGGHSNNRAFAFPSPSSTHKLCSTISEASGRSENEMIHYPRNRNNYFDQLAAASMGIANVITEQLLSHPCIVLRRQIQVNAIGQSYHLTPLTLINTIYTLQNNQGISCLWKGVSSSIVVKGLSSAVEILIGDTFGLPRMIVENARWDKIMHHVLLKILSFCVTTPFVISAFIETVRSDTTTDRSHPWDCVSVGLTRLGHDVFGPRDRDGSRRFSVFYLATPSVAFRFSHYLVSELAYNITYHIARRHVQRKSTRYRTLFDDYFPALFARFASSLIADGLLYPFELVLHRLYLQGARAIIDNLDTGMSVVAVSTKYLGIHSCFSSILRSDGPLGLYKGMGALCLQYTLHFWILRLTRLIFDYMEELTAKRPPPASISRQTTPIETSIN